MTLLHKVSRGKGWCSFVLQPYAANIMVWDIRNPPKHITLTPEEIEEVAHWRAYATVLENKRGEICFGLALPRRYNEYNVWHESIHTIDNILSDRGVPITEQNGEARTYATEYLVKLIKQNYYNKKVTDLE